MRNRLPYTAAFPFGVATRWRSTVGRFSWQALLARRSGLFDRLDSCQPVAPFGTAGLPLPPQPDWKGLSLYLTDRDALWAIDLAILET
jgi:hypothetical protein